MEDTRFDIKNEASNGLNTRHLLENGIDKKVRIILVRCDENKNHAKLSNDCVSKTETKIQSMFNCCKKSFNTKRGLEQHIRIVHNTIIPSKYLPGNRKNLVDSRPIGKFSGTIEESNKEYQSKGVLCHHKKFEQGNFRYPCDNCGQKMITMTHHLSKCLGTLEKTFHCSAQGCNSSFFTKKTLDQHTKFVHKNFRYTCDKCGKRVVKLKAHQSFCLSDGVRKFHCTVENCKSSFIAETGLKIHVKSVHTATMKCPYEGCMSYFKPCVLKKHIRFAHERSEKSQCKNCGGHFYDVSPHFARCTSDGIKKLPCPFDNCTSKFTLETDLKIHVRRTHAMPIKCPHKSCQKFIKSGSLIKHLKLVHEKVREKCKRCGKSFKNLYWHQRGCLE